MNSTLEAEVLQLHAEICGGLADPTRIMMLYALMESPCNVSELCAQLGINQPFASRHLKVLRERGMVQTERRGNVIVYRLGDERIVQALDLLRAAMREILSRRVSLVDAMTE